ncbi:hypothetical protein D3C87_1517910 [compost metagenome]
MSMVEVKRPPMTTTAMGERNSAPAPMPRAIGSMPSTIAAVVMRIGRIRTWAPRMTASRRE